MAAGRDPTWPRPTETDCRCTDLSYDGFAVKVDWAVFLSVLVHLDLDRLAILLALEPDVDIHRLAEREPRSHQTGREESVEKMRGRKA
jgi:hypothetical protein